MGIFVELFIILNPACLAWTLRSRIIRSKAMNIWYILLNWFPKWWGEFILLAVLYRWKCDQVSLFPGLSNTQRKFHLNKKTWSLHLQDQMLKTALSLPLLAPTLLLASRLLLNLILKCSGVLSSPFESPPRDRGPAVHPLGDLLLNPSGDDLGQVRSPCFLKKGDLTQCFLNIFGHL